MLAILVVLLKTKTRLNIINDYTPKTIDSLARLIIGLNISKVIKPLNDEEKDEAPHDTGTHEVISQLLLGISTIKKTLEHASAIGRSALLLSYT
jgi:hypothetical protein